MVGIYRVTSRDYLPRHRKLYAGGWTAEHLDFFSNEELAMVVSVNSNKCETLRKLKSHQISV